MERPASSSACAERTETLEHAGHSNMAGQSSKKKNNLIELPTDPKAGFAIGVIILCAVYYFMSGGKGKNK
jgi:hypothetical protein